VRVEGMPEESQRSKRERVVRSLGSVVVAASVGVAGLRSTSWELPFQQTSSESSVVRSYNQKLAFVEEDDVGARDVRTIQPSDNKEPEIKLTFTEKCFALAFLGVAVGLPCLLCWVRSSPEKWEGE